MLDPFVAPEEVLDYLHEKIKTEAGSMGIKYVAYGDEELLPEYPAVRVTAEPLTREIHGTHRFQNYFNISIWVYHAKLSVSHAVRSREDLELCTTIRSLLHADPTLDGGVIFGFIVSEFPGIFNRPKGAAVVGTRMVWAGSQQETF